jgi:hypothetical protein
MLARVPTRRISLRTSRYCYSTLETVSGTKEGTPLLELDASYQKLAEDIKLSLELHKGQSEHANGSQEYNGSSDAEPSTNALTESLGDGSEGVKSNHWKRKSPEARLGSNRIGQLKLPFELVSSMQLLVDGMPCLNIVHFYV